MNILSGSEYTPRKISRAQNQNLNTELKEKDYIEKIRPDNLTTVVQEGTGKEEFVDEFRVLLQNSNMKASAGDEATTNEISTGFTKDEKKSRYEITDENTKNGLSGELNQVEIKNFSTEITTDHKFKKIDGGIQVIGDYSTENNLTDGGVDDLNWDNITSSDFWDKFGAAAGRTAISEIPGFSAVAEATNIIYDAVNKALGTEEKSRDETFNELNRSLIGIESLKSQADNKKEYTNSKVYRLNNSINFPTGTVDSNKYGSLHQDKASNWFQSKRADSGFWKSLGLDILQGSLGAANSLLGVNIPNEMDFWEVGSDTEETLNAQEALALQSVNSQNIYNEKPGAFIRPLKDETFKQEHKDLYENVKNLNFNTNTQYNKNAGNRDDYYIGYLSEGNDLEKRKNPNLSFNIFDPYYAGRSKYFDRFEAKSIGYIYVEPYFNKTGINVFTIPFQFNPEISEGSISAKYSTEEILGRITAARYYINTDSQATTIKAKYIATNQNHDIYEEEYMNGMPRRNYIGLDYNWYEYWTPEKLSELERKYRSLVFPLRDGDYLVKPPIIQVYINGENNIYGSETIENVLSYPLASNDEYLIDGKTTAKSSYETYGGKPVFEHTKVFDDSIEKESDGQIGGLGNVKRFIITDVKIEDIENTNGWNYDTLTSFRRGFTVTLTLAETTRNFLDQVPDFKAYYDAFETRRITNEESYKVAGENDHYIRVPSESESSSVEYEYGSGNSYFDFVANKGKAASDIDNARAELEEQQDTLDNAKDKRENYKKGLEGEKSYKKEKEKQLKNTNKTIKEKNKAYDDLTKQINNANNDQATIDALTQKRDGVYNELIDLYGERSSLETSISTTDNNISMFNNIIGGLDTEISGYKNDVKTQKNIVKQKVNNYNNIITKNPYFALIDE